MQIERKTDSSFRSGFVGLIGKPNVGKSTILNYFLGRKISITSPRPQTTRARILGILTKPNAQVIFIDTPGWHKPKHVLGKYLVNVAKGVIEEVDVTLAIVDAKTGLEKEDEWVFERIKAIKRTSILVINKMDLINKNLALPIIEKCHSLNIFKDYVPISAITGENMDVLMNQIVSYLPDGPSWYSEEQLTDQNTETIICEFIREEALKATRDEVPHSVAVFLEEATQKQKIFFIRATILVEREGQKAIIIGKQGSMLKKIGQEARIQLENYLGTKIFLELWVRVSKSWRQNPSILNRLGYEKKE